jgi:hypothetical protein
MFCNFVVNISVILKMITLVIGSYAHFSVILKYGLVRDVENLQFKHKVKLKQFKY